MAPPPSSKHTYRLWILDIFVPALHRLTMDGERKHP